MPAQVLDLLDLCLKSASFGLEVIEACQRCLPCLLKAEVAMNLWQTSQGLLDAQLNGLFPCACSRLRTQT